MSFDGCWDKVAWAKEHRDMLEGYINGTFRIAENRPRVGIGYEPESDCNVLYVSYMPNLDSFFTRAGLLIGDTIHALRSALDYVAFECAMQRTKGNIKNPRAVAWPITEKIEHWRTARGSNLREVSVAHRALIERNQHHKRFPAGLPANTLDSFLLIRDIDDSYKHRALLPVLMPTAGVADPNPGAMMLFMVSALSR